MIVLLEKTYQTSQKCNHGLDMIQQYQAQDVISLPEGGIGELEQDLGQNVSQNYNVYPLRTFGYNYASQLV